MESKYSDQSGLMPRLIRIFDGCKAHFVGLVTQRIKHPFHMMCGGLVDDNVNSMDTDDACRLLMSPLPIVESGSMRNLEVVLT